jgi:hypothetical protein
MCTRRRLLEIKGFSELKVDKIKEAVAKCQPGGASGGFITAHELRETRRCVFRLSTGARGFDAMLGGYDFLHPSMARWQERWLMIVGGSRAGR